MGDGGVAKSFPFILRFCEARRDIERCVDDVGCKLEKCAGSPSFGTRQRVLAAPLVAASCWFEKKYRSFVPGLRYEASAAAHLALPAVGCRWASFTRAACAPAIPQMIGSIIAFSVIVEYRGSSEYNYIVSPQYQWPMSCLRRTFRRGATGLRCWSKATTDCSACRPLQRVSAGQHTASWPHRAHCLASAAPSALPRFALLAQPPLAASAYLQMFTGISGLVLSFLYMVLYMTGGKAVGVAGLACESAAGAGDGCWCARVHAGKLGGC